MTFMIEHPVELAPSPRDENPLPLPPTATGSAAPGMPGAVPGTAAATPGIVAYRLLRSFAAEILATDDLERLLARCGLLAQRLLHADACSIALIDESTGQLVPLLAMASERTTALVSLPREFLDGRMRAAIYAGRSLVVAHDLVLDGDVALPLAAKQSTLAAMLIPLPLEQGQRGIFWVGRIHGEPFTPEDQALAETLSVLVALGVRATRTAGQLAGVVSLGR